MRVVETTSICPPGAEWSLTFAAGTGSFPNSFQEPSDGEKDSIKVLGATPPGCGLVPPASRSCPLWATRSGEIRLLEHQAAAACPLPSGVRMRFDVEHG